MLKAEDMPVPVLHGPASINPVQKVPDKELQIEKTQQSLRNQIRDANRSTAITEMASYRDIRWGKYERHKRF